MLNSLRVKLIKFSRVNHFPLICCPELKSYLRIIMVLCLKKLYDQHCKESGALKVWQTCSKFVGILKNGVRLQYLKGKKGLKSAVESLHQWFSLSADGGRSVTSESETANCTPPPAEWQAYHQPPSSLRHAQSLIREETRDWEVHRSV